MNAKTPKSSNQPRKTTPTQNHPPDIVCGHTGDTTRQSVSLPAIGVIFDLDGVIVNTDKYHRLGWKRLAEELDIPFSDEQAQRTRGVDRMESLRIVLGPGHNLAQAEMEALAACKNAYYTESIQAITAADILPGATALIDEIDANGIPMAIGSASKNAKPVLERLGISHRFTAIVTGNDFERGKPAPDVFLTAARRMDISPARCLVFEDAAAGIEAARAGGMRAVGIGSPTLLAGADRVVASLDKISFRDIAEIMQYESLA